MPKNRVMVSLTGPDQRGEPRTFGPFCHAGLRWNTLFGYDSTVTPIAYWDKKADGWIPADKDHAADYTVYTDINIYEEDDH